MNDLLHDSRWKVTLNGRVLESRVDYKLHTNDDSQHIRIRLYNQCLVEGEVKSFVNWDAKTIDIEAPRNALIAMRKAINSGEGDVIKEIDLRT